MESPVERIVGDSTRRLRVENVISEAVRFFNLNALSSPILTKVHFDVAMTMILPIHSTACLPENSGALSTV